MEEDLEIVGHLLAGHHCFSCHCALNLVEGSFGRNVVCCKSSEAKSLPEERVCNHWRQREGLDIGISSRGFGRL